MDIIRYSDGVFTSKSNGTAVTYHMFKEYEIHFNRMNGNSIQEWHRHEVLEEVLIVISGTLHILWLNGKERKSATLSKGDIARVERSIHTVENKTDTYAEFLVFRLMLDGNDKRSIIKNDKIVITEGFEDNE